MKSALVPTASSSTLSSSSQARKTLPITMPVATTPLARRSLTSSWRGFLSITERKTSILSAPPTLTLTASLARLCLPSLLPSDLMEP
ncbi:hypothetical protein LEMLEM_LOCUS10486 [Lemmus lemmus]